MDTALEEEALAITSIYGPASFYPIPSLTAHSSSPKGKRAAAEASQPHQQQQPVVYTLKVSLEEPDFDADPLVQTAASAIGHLSLNHQQQPQRKELELRVFFPAGYPEQVSEPPVHEIVSIYYGAIRITPSMVDEINRGLAESYVPGEVVIFNWMEWLKTWLEDLQHREDDDEEEAEEQDKEEEVQQDKVGRQGAENVDHGEGVGQADDEEVGKTVSEYYDGPSNDDHHHHHHHHHHPSHHSSPTSPRISGHHVFQIKTGQPLVDRKSVFIAHLAAIDQPGQVPLMIQQLKQENKKVIKATHNIMAYRVQNANGTIAQDNDDDGETAAGSRLLHLMSILDVKNVVVVVSRWYGGIQLGADRFKHINNTARQLLEEEGYVHQPGKSGSGEAAGGSSGGSSKSKRKSGKQR
ncbi:hypothetical protein DFQ27_008963 [Actinomortierella ambigua]|uniref:RWD domain-containing protein n=1 Tax=Actinomortierella ambigua TaxID=1343610 RepID=A0A9P6PSG9_9FUNG|nr:hypothetical protein DFQ27_008963 [Actinomortierella ambigua]